MRTRYPILLRTVLRILASLKPTQRSDPHDIHRCTDTLFVLSSRGGASGASVCMYRLQVRAAVLDTSPGVFLGDKEKQILHHRALGNWCKWQNCPHLAIWSQLISGLGIACRCYCPPSAGSTKRGIILLAISFCSCYATDSRTQLSFPTHEAGLYSVRNKLERVCTL